MAKTKINKKNKKGKKLKLSTVILFFVLVILISCGIYFFLTAEDEESSLTLLEKQWIEKNKATLIDIKVPNNLSVLSENGEGMIFDLLNKIELETGLKFNKISYDYPLSETNKQELGIIVLKNTDALLETDILITEDSYILLGLNSGFVDSIDAITNTKVGVLETDKDVISNYLNNNVNYTAFTTLDDLYKALSEKTVDYIIVPRYASLNHTITSDVYTKYNFNNLSNKIVLRLSNIERLNNIIIKFLDDWKISDLRKSKEVALMKYFVSSNEITDIDKHTLTSKVYKYGFVEGTVYNVVKTDKLYGVAGEYINTLSNMTNMEFSYHEYKSNADLLDALNNGKIDIAFINFNHENDVTKKSSSPFVETMAAISNNYQNVSDRNGLNNRKLYLYESNYLYDFITSNYNGVIKSLDKISQKIEDDSIIILDEAEYVYYKENELASYKLLFVDSFIGNYHFEMSLSDEVLGKLVDFVLNNTDYNEYENTGVNNLLNTLSKEKDFKNIYMIIVAIILIPVIFIFISLIANRNVKKLKVIRKEDVLKYNDMLTSLKNRNYLNININKWDDTKVYPRTIIVVDLNNLKYVNDNYGHEEGNNLIKRAAAILINTQLEKSEIIRSDGNEFLIYLIGYNKNQVNTYISKLCKEFEKLPHGFGAAVGYSMIEDEIKTIDDAINEATIQMRIDKEKNYR